MMTKNKKIMKLFEDSVRDIRILKRAAKQVRDKFISSDKNISEILKWIIQAELDSKSTHHVCLTIHTCNSEQAQKLRDIGFTVTEDRNEFGQLCGHDISWEAVE